MLDITKLLSGLFQNGGETPGKQMSVGISPGQTPGINPGAIPLPEPGQTPGINPNQHEAGQILPGKPGIDWKARMLGGLQGFQAAQPQQPQAPTPAPMDMEQIKQLQFAHRQNGGIIPRGRY